MRGTWEYLKSVCGIGPRGICDLVWGRQGQSFFMKLDVHVKPNMPRRARTHYNALLKDKR